MTVSLEIQKDISLAKEIWSELLRKRGIRFAYAKGSAFKPIQSYLDYVPIISDIDIHLEYPQSCSSIESLDNMMAFAEVYHTKFTSARPENVHVPRMQLVDVKNLEDKEWYFPPSVDEITILFGEEFLDYPNSQAEERFFVDGTPLTPANLHLVDRQRMESENDFLQSFPAKMIDRTGIDLWSEFRQLNFRVSPSIFRVLAKHAENPVEVWGYNRTKAHSTLVSLGYTDLANNMAMYYKLCWKQFEREMQDDGVFFEMIRLGYKLVLDCYNIVLS